MDLKHLSQVLEIEKQSFLTPWSYQAFAYEILYNDFGHYIVALDDQRVLGYGGIWVVLDEAHVTNIAVHPGFRNRGLGRQLMQQLIDKAVELGAAKMTLEVRPSNKYARLLYSSLGFVEYGIRKNYYTDTNEDAIIMWKYDLKKNS
ncbi:MAG: ribosomal protein S18-alanine N-acetyltransferase [Desulfotomaculum sp.]|nr:ribosomal protein S18-alanine N-acetyltransferase [Desulfotomaculum sp.]